MMKSQFPLKYQELPKEISSEYIDGGFSTEFIKIKNVNFNLEKRLATASVNVETDFENSYGEGKDNSYHWSVITAYRIVSQLAIGYICTELKMLKRQIGEIMQISSNMNTTAPICQTKDIPIKIEFSKYIKRGNRVLGEFMFDIHDKVFHGNIRFAVDLS